MERDADPVAAACGRPQQVEGHLRVAAELVRQRPVGGDAGGQDAAEHGGARGLGAELVELLDAVEREQAHAPCERVGDVGLLLDRVAVRDPVGRGARGEDGVDLADAGDVERRAQLDEQAQDVGVRVRLDGVEDPGVREGRGERAVAFGDDVEVDDEARRRGFSVGDEAADPLMGSGRRVVGQAEASAWWRVRREPSNSLETRSVVGSAAREPTPGRDSMHDRKPLSHNTMGGPWNPRSRSWRATESPAPA